MRRIALIYNPASGPRRSTRVADVGQAARVFREHGEEAVMVATEGPGTGGAQALDAISRGADAIVCCGGDGTIHDVAQALVEHRAMTPVAVVPLGTGNGLASELGTSRLPANAAWEILRYVPQRIAVGKIETAGRDGAPISRYFLISAGLGADAEMIYQLSVETKARYGLRAYYGYAIQLFLTHRFFPFEVEYRVRGESESRRDIAAQVLVGRIERFGGMVSRLTPGASLHAPDMQLVLFPTPRRWPVFRHATAAVLRSTHRARGVQIVSVSEIECRAVKDHASLPAAWRRTKLASRVYAQADGELLGGVPVRMSMVPDALTLLMPPAASSP